MTLDRLRNALEALGPPVTPLELAEMLWLAERIPGGGTPSEAPDGPNSGDVGTGMLLGPAQGAPCATRAGTPRVEEPTPETEAAAPAPVDEARRPLHVSRRRAGVDAEEVLVPAAQVLRGELAIQRALRPLKRRVPDRRRLILNEDATAALAARHPGLRPWAPVMVPGSERFLSLALVVDAGPTMTIWDPLVSELHEAMQRTGAFRDLRVWHLTDNGMHLGIRSGPSSPVRNPAALLDPTGRQVVLVLSDCAGPHWWAGHTAPYYIGGPAAAPPRSCSRFPNASGGARRHRRLPARPCCPTRLHPTRRCGSCRTTAGPQGNRAMSPSRSWSWHRNGSATGRDCSWRREGAVVTRPSYM